MAAERFFIEAWLRGGEAESVRKMYGDHDTYHPHVTLVRPGSLISTEEELLGAVVDFCRGKYPIAYQLSGKASFGEFAYIPVESPELLEFSDGLEGAIAPMVSLEPKLGDKRILHVTILAGVQEAEPFTQTEFYMLRITVMRGKRIAFSYDLVTQEVLNREESLDPVRWQQTVDKFNETRTSV